MISRGISHKCTLPSRVENFSSIIQQAGPKVVDQVITSLLKGKMGTHESTVSLSQPRGGKALKISVGAKPTTQQLKPQLFTADDLLKIETSTHLTGRKTLEVAKAIRVATSNMKVIEPNLKKKIV